MREGPVFGKPRVILGGPNWATEDGVTNYGNTLVLHGSTRGARLGYTLVSEGKKRFGGDDFAPKSGFSQAGTRRRRLVSVPDTRKQVLRFTQNDSSKEEHGRPRLMACPDA